MQFIASITRRANDIRKIIRLWQESEDPRNPLKRVLITPLFTPPNTLQLIRDWRENGKIEEVYFDSGGYFVQMGRISYEEMYWQLLQFYRVKTTGLTGMCCQIMCRCHLIRWKTFGTK